MTGRDGPPRPPPTSPWPEDESLGIAHTRRFLQQAVSAGVIDAETFRALRIALDSPAGAAGATPGPESTDRDDVLAEINAISRHMTELADIRKGLRDRAALIMREDREAARESAKQATRPDDLVGDLSLDGLSDQQLQIFYLVGRKLSDRQIAYSLNLTETRVKHQVSNLLRKMGMSRRSELAAFAALQATSTGPEPAASPGSPPRDESRDRAAPAISASPPVVPVRPQPDEPIQGAPAPSEQVPSELPPPRVAQAQDAPAPVKPVAPPPAIPPPAIPAPATRTPSPSAPPRTPAPLPAPQVPSRPGLLETWSRKIGESSRSAWSRLSAEIAANALTYLGVLLATVVVFVFFANGYFGRLVGDDQKHFRPLFIVGTVFFFLGIARLLRRGANIPGTAIAVEMIGVVLIPVMMAALFRDGCTPAYRVWCQPPDVDGPMRWMVYGAVGVASAAIYYLFAKRRNIYAYLVAPVLWVGVGALGLYLEDGVRVITDGAPLALETFARDGISGAQFVAVLVGMSMTIVVAGRIRARVIGSVVAVPAVRAAVALAPVVLALSFVFAYSNDTVAGGSRTTKDLAPTVIAALLAAAGVFALGSRAAFAWESLSERLQREGVALLRTAAYISVGAAWAMTAGYDVAPSWVGVGFVVYGVLVGLLDRLAGGTGSTAMWIARTAAGAGAVAALIDPLPALVAWSVLAIPGLLGGRSAPVEQFVNDVVSIPDHSIARLLRLWIPLAGALGAGAARLGWPGTTAWVLAGAAALFALARLAPATVPELRSLARFPAIAAAGAALAVEIYLQVRGTGMSPYMFGGFLIMLGAVAAMIDIPWVTRLPVSSGLFAAGAIIILRQAFATSPLGDAWIDTAVLSVLGALVVAGSLASPRRAGRVANGILGHVLVACALARSLSFEPTALFGLSVVAAVYAAEAAAIEMERPGLFGLVAARAGVGGRFVEAVPSLVVTAAVIPIALLAGRQIPFIRDERPRFGPVLSAVSWVYVAGSWLRKARIRKIVVPSAYAAAAAGIAVSLPSATAVLTAAWSAALATAALAVAMRRPYATTVSWALAAVGTSVSAARLGVQPGDMNFVLHTIAVLLLSGPAVVQAVRGPQAGLVSPWLRAPVAVGLLLIPGTIAIAISDGRLLAVVAIAAASGYAVLGWSTRTGGLSVPVAFSLAIAYAHTLHAAGWAHPFDQPLVWMPLAAVYVSVTAILPGCRSWRALEDAAPGMLVSGLAISALTVILSFAAGTTPEALAYLGGLLLIVYAIRRSDGWLAGAIVSLAVSGLVAGGYWAPLVALAAATASAVRSDYYAESPIGTALQWIAAAWLAASFALLGVWQRWDATSLAVASSIGGAVALTLSGSLSLTASAPVRARRWALPLQGLGQAAATTLLFTAADALDANGAFGVAAGVSSVEAGLAGIVGTAKRRSGLVALSGILVATSYGLMAAWLGWEAVELVVVTAPIGVVLVAAWTFAYLVRPAAERLLLWVPSVGVGSQVAAVTVLSAAWMGFETQAAYGVTAAVFAVEALVVGVVATVRCREALVAPSGLLGAAAYGLAVAWAEWPARTFVAVTALVGGVLLVAWTASALRREPWTERVDIWLSAVFVAGQVAMVAVVVASWLEFTPREFYGVVAGVAAAEASVVALLGASRSEQRLISLAAALFAVSYGFAAGWLAWDAADLISATAAIGAASLSCSTVGRIRGATSVRARLLLPLASALAHSAAFTVGITAAIGLDAHPAYGVIAATAAVEGVALGWLATVRRQPPLVNAAGALLTGAFGLFLAWLDRGPWVTVAVAGVAGATLLLVWTLGYLNKMSNDRLRMWLPVAGIDGLLAAAAVVAVAAVGLEAEVAYGVIVATAGFLAVLSGVIATIRLEGMFSAAAFVFTATAYGFTSPWLGWSATTYIVVTSLVGVTVVALATSGYLGAQQSPRLRFWLPVEAVAGEVAAVSVVAVAWIALELSAAYAVTAGAAAYGAALAGLFGTVREDRTIVGGSAALVAVAYGFAVAAAGPTPRDVVAMTLVVTGALAAIATVATARASRGSRLSLWGPATHSLGVIGIVATIGLAVEAGPIERTFLVAAVSAVGVGVYASINDRWAPADWQLPMVGAAGFVAGAAFLATWSESTQTAARFILFAIAILGLAAAAAWNSTGSDVRWRYALATMSVGWTLFAVGASATRYGAGSDTTAAVLLIAGGVLAIHGVLARRLLALEAALVVWAVAGLALLDERVSLPLQAIVALLGASLLAVLEIERHRRRIEELEDLDALRSAEWALMAVPLGFAAYGMVDQLWFGLVLFAEGLLLLGWGAISHVRRRAAVGFGGAVLAVLLAVSIPTIRGVNQGLTGGTWLLIGAIASVVFLVAGSTIERRRAAIGQSLRRLGEIMEGWE